MFEKRSKWITGILVTLMMVVVAAVPVMAKEYKVDLSAKEGEENSVESLPETLQEGDVLTLTSPTYNDSKRGEIPAEIYCQYEGAEGLSWYKYRDVRDEEKSVSCVVERVNDVSEWKVRASQKYVKDAPDGGYIAGVFVCLRADKNTKYNIEWDNECKKGTVGEDYDTAFWVFRDLSKHPGYKSVRASIEETDNLDLPKGVKVRTGADPRNGGRMGINFKGTPTESGTFHPVIYGTVVYSNDEGDSMDFNFKWSFKIQIDKKDSGDDDDDDDDDDHEEPAPSENTSNSGSSAPSSPAATTGSTVSTGSAAATGSAASAATGTPAQQAASQLTAAQTAIASVPALLATNGAAYSQTGMPLDMTKVSTLDASTATMLAANNKIPYNVTISFNGAPFTVKIPAGFDYKGFVKADGSVNIHEVLWSILSKQFQTQNQRR